jgi:mannose-6-phosphate isomerase-like protein (cupin superfamily)
VVNLVDRVWSILLTSLSISRIQEVLMYTVSPTIHVSPDRAEVFDVHDVRFHSFHRGDRGSEQLAAWRADFPPDTPGQAHTMDAEEVPFVLEGRLEARIGDQIVTVRSGQSVRVPAGREFCASTADGEGASCWVVTRRGMRATMSDSGAEMAPPWAQ